MLELSTSERFLSRNVYLEWALKLSELREEIKFPSGYFSFENIVSIINETNVFCCQSTNIPSLRFY